MLEILTKIFCFSLFAILNFYLIKKLVSSSEKLFTIKNTLLLILLIVISTISYTTTYLIYPVLIRIIISIIIYKMMLDRSILKVSISYFIVTTVTLIGDILSSLIIINIIDLEAVRNCWYIMLIINVIVIIFTILIFKIKPIIAIIQKFLFNIMEEDHTIMFILYSLIYIISISVVYKLSIIYEINLEYIINTVVILVLILLILILSLDKMKYYKLLSSYDSLFEYVQNFEDTIDDMNLSNHEYKNQLAILKSYIEEKDFKKALDTVNDMTKENYKQDANILSQLKNIPKGGIKGLLYYKIITAQNNNLNICIDASEKTYKYLKKLNQEEVKITCRLIGIYLDNAIEASKISRKKQIVIEIYNIDDMIEFVFSNTYNKSKLDIKKIGKKGYTTKGKNRGKGTYLANKMVSKNDWIKQERLLVNNLYVQKIIIDK